MLCRRFAGYIKFEAVIGLLLLLSPILLFVVAFIAGALMNHPQEMPPRRLNRIVAVGWACWTVVCALLLYAATAEVCPRGGCVGLLVGATWIGLGLLWLVAGGLVTAGIYAARNYLRNH